MGRGARTGPRGGARGERPASASRRACRSRSPTTCTRRSWRASTRPGIEALWAHQADALEAARRGHAIVTTGTASGKSLAFNLPVLDTLASDVAARAFYLYPTKALAQDQARGLAQHRREVPAPRDLRRRHAARGAPRDPPALEPDPHEPGHAARRRAAEPPPWGDVLANLAWIVVDEAHVYRGVFGSHVANVLRRLRRLARAYGSEPRFLLTSATIANPAELAERLTGVEVELVDRDGAPRAERQIAMWNPPLVDEKLGRRASALGEAANLLAALVEREIRTICFLKSRRGVELIQRFARQRLEDAGRIDLAERIAPYRAGYTPAQRREIEQRLSEGELLAVVATDALELGIDIGDLDAALCVTFPGTVASLRQMWGRAGRRSTGPRDVRGRRGRARPVLLPPPHRVPRAAGGAGDPRPRVRADPRGAPRGGRVRAAADARGRRDLRAALGGARAAAGPAGRAARARRALPAARAGLSGGADRAALGVAGLGRDRGGRRRRGDRHGRDRARPLGGAPGRRSTCTWARRSRWRSSTWRSTARSCVRSTATGTRSRRRSPRPGSSRCATSATRAA